MIKRDYWKKEWTALEKKEARYQKQQQKEAESMIRQKLSQKIPDKLEATLNTAFLKAFEVVFEKGTGIIEKTYNREQHEMSYRINEYAADIQGNKKNVKAFSKQAGAAKRKNLLVSGVEGAGLGILGIGIPDIPLFTAVILKSIYEIALSYGYNYERGEEQWFILKIIETALLRGSSFDENDRILNTWIEQKGIDVMTVQHDRKIQTARTAESLSEALLYMKFLQGIPIVGVAGGLADTVYLKKITDYAELKYKRRFLKR